VHAGESQCGLEEDAFDLFLAEAVGVRFVEFQRVDADKLEDKPRFVLILLEIDDGHNIGVFKFFQELRLA
jgi:hypothetical protein